MKQYLNASKKIAKADGNEISVSYFVVSEELTGEDGRTVCECFGVSLESDHGQKAMVRAVTMSFRRAERLALFLAENDVLPMELDAVLENCLNSD